VYSLHRPHASNCVARLDEIEKDLRGRVERALKSTAPIFRCDEGGRLELFGTGLLVRCGSRHFLISAAHVGAELRQHSLAMGGENRTVPVAEPFFHTGAVGEVEFEVDLTAGVRACPARPSLSFLFSILK
jgi:hypothetical protein